MAKWRLASIVAVRTTGFGVELLSGLRFGETVAALRPVLAADRTVGEHRAELLAVLRRLERERRGDRDVHRELARAQRRVTAEQPVPDAAAQALDSTGNGGAARAYNAAIADRDRLIAAAHRVYEQELPLRRRALAEAVARPDVQEALLLLSPDMLDTARRYVAGAGSRRTADLRKTERRLTAYLQRLALKNETNSFFGPVNYGHLAGDHDENLTVHRGSARLAERTVFAAQWMVQALAKAVGDDPEVRPYLSPRRAVGGWRGTGDEPDTALHRLADGTLTVVELAARIGLSQQETLRRVLAADAAGWLVAGPVVPPDLADPLGWLAGWLDRLPGSCRRREHWATIVGRFTALVTAFATADPPEREMLLATVEDLFTATVGQPARRHGGRMYADRSLLYEECRGDLTVLIGGDLYREVHRRIQPVLRLAEANGVLQWRRDQAAAHGLWQRLANGKPGVPLLRYLRELASSPIAGVAGPDELTAFTDALRDLVRERSDGRVARLAGDELPVPPLPDEVLRITSLDLMLAAPNRAAIASGDYRLVVGEIHAQPLTWAFPTGHFLPGPDRQRLCDELSAAIDGHRPVTFAHTRSSKVYPYPLTGPVIELRPRLATTGAIPATDVEISQGDDGLALRAPGHDRLRLYPALRRRHEPLDPVAPFSYPSIVPPVIDCGAHTPRVEIDGVVLQRERWVLPGGALLRGGHEDKDFGRFLAAWRLKESVGLPDEVYVRVPTERKPVFVSFDNGFLVEAFDHLARTSQEIAVSEALPATSELWLDGPDGRHTCEFRTIATGAT